jgi:hypothetical protein
MEKLDSAVMEEQILLLLDGELDPKQEKLVWRQIEHFPEYRAMYEEYKQVYLIAEEMEIPAFDYKHLLKEEGAFVSRKKFKLAPVWGVAAGITVILGLSYFLMQETKTNEKEWVKSEKVQEVLQPNLPPNLRDSLHFKRPLPKNTTTPKRNTIESKVQKNVPQLAMVRQNEKTPEVKTTIPSLAHQNIAGLAELEYNAPQSLPQLLVAAVPELEGNYKEGIKIEFSESKGLLSEMVKAGQWIMGEHKHEKTIQIAIGDNEKRTIKFKL